MYTFSQSLGSWSATLAAEPKKLLRDGQPWSEFSNDKAAKRIMVKSGGDPRLHVFERVLREQGIDLIGKKDAKIEEITVGHRKAHSPPCPKRPVMAIELADIMRRFGPSYPERFMNVFINR